jgi:hypothetical protein
MPNFIGKLEPFGKLALAIAIVFLALSLCANTDISLFDESIYLSQGLGHYPDFSIYERGPLYSLYYYIISLKVSDPITLYTIGSTLNIITSVSLLLSAIYVFTRSLALCTAAFILLVSSNLIEVWPYVSFLAVTFISAGAILIFQRKSIIDSISISTLVFFLLCFIRPEFVISFYAALTLTLVITFYHLYTTFKGDIFTQLKNLRTSAFSLFAVAALSILWSFPILSSSGRSFLAFGQHYALRKFETGQVTIDPWLNWLSILHNDAPNTHSISDILKNYPNVLISHISANLHEFLGSIVNIVAAPFEQNAIATSAIVIALILIAAKFFTYRQTVTPHIESENRKGTVLFLILASAPSFISVISIYPRAHYTLILFSCCVLLLANLFTNRRLSGTPFASVSLVAALAILIPQPVAHDKVNLSTIIDIRNSTAVHKMLEVDGGWCVYLSCQLIFASDIPQNISVAQYIKQNDIDSVMVSSRMREYAKGISDRTLQEFLDTATQNGWKSIPLRNGATLLHRN